MRNITCFFDCHFNEKGNPSIDNQGQNNKHSRKQEISLRVLHETQINLASNYKLKSTSKNFQERAVKK